MTEPTYATGGVIYPAPVEPDGSCNAVFPPRSIADAHSRSAAAVLWSLHGDLDMVRHEVSLLDEAERDELQKACALVIAATDPAAQAHERYRLALARRGIGR